MFWNCVNLIFFKGWYPTCGGGPSRQCCMIFCWVSALPNCTTENRVRVTHKRMMIAHHKVELTSTCLSLPGLQMVKALASGLKLFQSPAAVGPVPVGGIQINLVVMIWCLRAHNCYIIWSLQWHFRLAWQASCSQTVDIKKGKLNNFSLIREIEKQRRSLYAEEDTETPESTTRYVLCQQK